MLNCDIESGSINVGIWLEQQNQGKGIQTRSATPCTLTKERHSPEAKQHKGIEKPQQQQQAPAVPPARTFIRPHQVCSSPTNILQEVEVRVNMRLFRFNLLMVKLFPYETSNMIQPGLGF